MTGLSFPTAITRSAGISISLSPKSTSALFGKMNVPDLSSVTLPTSCVYSACNYYLNSFFKRNYTKNFGSWHFNNTCISNIYLGVRDQCSTIVEPDLCFLVLDCYLFGYFE